MENPESWDLLTSSLAVSNLNEIDRTWAFLVSQGLVISQETAKQVLEQVVTAVLKEGEITGPSEALRVAVQLESARITTDLATTPDPWGKSAKARLRTVKKPCGGG